MLWGNDYEAIIHADIDFKTKERQAILDACDEWFAFTKGKVLFTVTFDADKFDVDLQMSEHLLLRVNSSFYFIKKYNANNKSSCIGYCKYVDPGQGIIYIVHDKIRDASGLKLTAMHEFGHFLGLGHTEPNSVMQPISGVALFTEKDAVEFCKAFTGCQVTDLIFKKD